MEKNPFAVYSDAQLRRMLRYGEISDGLREGIEAELARRARRPH